MLGRNWAFFVVKGLFFQWSHPFNSSKPCSSVKTCPEPVEGSVSHPPPPEEPARRRISPKTPPAKTLLRHQTLALNPTSNRREVRIHFNPAYTSEPPSQPPCSFDNPQQIFGTPQMRKIIQQEPHLSQATLLLVDPLEKIRESPVLYPGYKPCLVRTEMDISAFTPTSRRFHRKPG